MTSVGSRGSMTQLSHLGLVDEHLQFGNLRPDLVLFADKVMDTLGQLLLVKEDQQRINTGLTTGAGPHRTR